MKHPTCDRCVCEAEPRLCEVEPHSIQRAIKRTEHIIHRRYYLQRFLRDSCRLRRCYNPTRLPRSYRALRFPKYK